MKTEQGIGICKPPCWLCTVEEPHDTENDRQSSRYSRVSEPDNRFEAQTSTC